MKNKLLVCVCAVALFGLVGCQKDNTDLLAIDAQLAQNTLLGIYVYTDIDSVAMSTTFYEWTIVKDGTGTYQKLVSGNGAGSEEQQSFTWKAEMAEDNLGMAVDLVFADASTRKATWANGVLALDEYVTTKVANSTIATVKTLSANLQDLTFQLDDTTFYQAEDSIPFLAWQSDVAFYAPEDTAVAKAQYLNDLAPYADTIKWYIAKYGPVASAHIDSVSGELVDLVVVSPTASSRGKNAGKHGITFIYSYNDTVVEMRNVGPLDIAQGTLTIKREGETNTAALSHRVANWTKEVYTKPTTKEATLSDSTFTVATAQWTIASITNQRAFSLLLKGSTNQKVVKQVAGEETENTDVTKDEAFTLLPLTGFNLSSGQVDYNGYTFKLKTE